jgi:hypothetical protein
MAALGVVPLSEDGDVQGDTARVEDVIAVALWIAFDLGDHEIVRIQGEEVQLQTARRKRFQRQLS